MFSCLLCLFVALLACKQTCYTSHEDFNRKNLKKFGKKALAFCAGVIAACSIALGSLAGTPDELFSGVSADNAGNRRSQACGRFPLAGKPKHTDPAENAACAIGCEDVFFAQPSIVRGIVLLPFWAVGKALLSLFSLLFTAMHPFLQILLGILLNALLLFGLFAIVLKLLFPNLRLRDLFKSARSSILAISSVLLAVADAVLRAYWEDYRPISVAIKLGVGSSYSRC